MLALAGFRRRLAAPVRSGGRAMPRKVRVGGPRGGGGWVAPAVTAPVPLFQGKGAAKQPPEAGAAAGPVVAAGDGCVRVAVRVKPGARCSAVTGRRRRSVGGPAGRGLARLA